MNMLRSPVWKPMTPGFLKAYRHLVDTDRFTKRCFDDILKVDPTRFRAIEGSDNHSALFAVPITVTKPSANVLGTMHGGMLMTLVDDCTSFHIIDRLLPRCPGHVSVQLSSNFVSAGVVGEELLGVSSVDKLGKSLVYTSITFYKPASKEAEEILAAACSLAEVRLALSKVPVIATGSHIKAITAKMDIM
jgi:acyl-coenzyme A thioesterase PaaI-like protein